MALRKFKKLRLSLTNSCNFSCVYCVHDGEPQWTQAQTSVDQFLNWIRSIHSINPLNEIRLTGGEPTLYRDLLPLVQRLSELGITNLAMTTNGYALEHMARPLQAAGLKSVNISVDALDENVFRSMGGKAPRQVFAGVDAALAAGLSVKINTTLVGELNDSQILPLLGWARARWIPIRFLELMAMGHLYRDGAPSAHGQGSARLVTAETILSIISEAFNFTALPREPHATTHYFELSDGYRFGIIGNSSLPFCSDCDRLRLDSKGKIFGCLSSAVGFSFDESKLEATLEHAMSLKQRDKFVGSALVMREVGG